MIFEALMVHKGQMGLKTIIWVELHLNTCDVWIFCSDIWQDLLVSRA